MLRVTITMISPGLHDTDSVLLGAGLVVLGVGEVEVALLHSSSRAESKVMEVTA